jgi:hypothetical protein
MFPNRAPMVRTARLQGLFYISLKSITKIFLNNFFSLPSNAPVNEPPQFSPTGAPVERTARLQGLFYISLKFITKISLNEKKNSFSQMPYEGSVPP